MDSELVALSKSVIESATLDFNQKKELLDEIRKLRPASENRWNHRYVIWTLALVAISTPIAFVFKIQTEIPDVLVALSSTAIGALAAFMTSALKK